MFRECARPGDGRSDLRPAVRSGKNQIWRDTGPTIQRPDAEGANQAPRAGSSNHKYSR